MYLTDEEARREVCPHITEDFADYVGPAGGTLVFRYQHINCRGSACKMAWRWRIGEEYVAAARQGYCGVAGKPGA